MTDITQLIEQLKKEHSIYWEKVKQLPETNWFDTYWNGVCSGLLFAIAIVENAYNINAPKQKKKNEVYK